MSETTRRRAWNCGRKMGSKTMTSDDVGVLIRASSPRCPSGIRNKALIATLYRTGLRSHEAVSLNVSDLDTAEGTLHVQHGKSGKTRRVGLPNDAMKHVLLWLGERHRIGLNGDGPLFSTLKGTTMSTRYVRGMMQRLAKRAGLDRRVNPHCFRHTNASELEAEGTPVTLIQKHLGHASLVTTQRYLDHVNPRAVIAANRNREARL